MLEGRSPKPMPASCSSLGKLLGGFNAERSKGLQKLNDQGSRLESSRYCSLTVVNKAPSFMVNLKSCTQLP